MTRRSLFFVLPLLLVGCTHKDSELVSAPVLVVNGEKLTAEKFAKALAHKLKLYDALAAKDASNIKRAREAVLNESIISVLLGQFAREHKIYVADGELLDEFERVRKTYPDDLTFKASLANEGMTVEDWKTRLAETILQRKVFAVLAPAEEDDSTVEKEALAYYNSHKQEFDRPAQVHIQQIVVSREDDAERILHKLKAGVPFSTLAQKFSISPDGAKGGDLGYVNKGTLPIFDSAFNLKPGQTSGVVKSSYGFHLIKVLDKRSPSKVSFDQAKGRLLREIGAKHQQTVFNRWLEQAIKSAKIERNDSLIEKVKVRTESREE